MISLLQKEIYQHREVDFRATWVRRTLYRRHLCSNGRFDRWLVPNNTTCVVLQQSRLSIWRSGDSVDQLILFQKCSLLEVCTPEMASKESLGRVRHFNLISQQVCAIFSACGSILFPHNVIIPFFCLPPTSNDLHTCMFHLTTYIGLQTRVKTKCSVLLFKISPINVVIACS